MVVYLRMCEWLCESMGSIVVHEYDESVAGRLPDAMVSSRVVDSVVTMVYPRVVEKDAAWVSH